MRVDIGDPSIIQRRRRIDLLGLRRGALQPDTRLGDQPSAGMVEVVR